MELGWWIFIIALLIIIAIFARIYAMGGDWRMQDKFWEEERARIGRGEKSLLSQFNEGYGERGFQEGI